MRASNKQLTILSEAEKAALYESPDFDDEQRLSFLNLTPAEQALVRNRATLSAQVHCALQIGYFKSMHMFFPIHWDEVQEDTDFIMQEYFPEHMFFHPTIITKHQYYAQCHAIAAHFGYQLWSKEFEPLLREKAEKIIYRDVSPQFIVIELLGFMREQKIMRPGYTTLQAIVSNALNAERKRLGTIIHESLTEADKTGLQKLLFEKETETLSGLADLKQDAKDFKPRMISAERDKMIAIKPLYLLAKSLLPKLKLSQQNLQYYASLVDYYTVYDLRKKLKSDQTYLYLVCYIHERYLKLDDNLMDAFCFQLKECELEIKEKAQDAYSEYAVNRQSELSVMQKLAELFIKKELSDEVSFGKVRQEAFTTIIPEDELRDKISNNNAAELKLIDFHWKMVDKHFHRFKLQLRPLMMAIDFSSTITDSPWLTAVTWLKEIFDLEKPIKKYPVTACPEKTRPKRLQKFLFDTNAKGEQKFHGDRYEFWIYRQMKKRLKAGELYLADSVHHRSLQQEISSAKAKESLVEPLNIPALKSPIKKLLDDRLADLRTEWIRFNNDFTQGKLKHLHYDEKTNMIHLKKSRAEGDEELQDRFYDQLPLCDITDVLRFVNERCRYSSIFTHIQPRYGKVGVDENSLNAVIIAQAFNNGNLNMAEISDIPYDKLLDIYQSRMRLQTLKKANDIIGDDIAEMPIFPYYSLDMAILYGGVDGQKYEVERPTLKARRSKKYFKKGKGVVAYTLLVNHIPLQTELIGAHEHESYFAFDIWYNNTSSIMPNAITGDMHIINKTNFAIMDWFGGQLCPRFTNLETQRKHLFCGDDPSQYNDWLIKPVGKIDRQLIEDEWPNIEPIIKALGLKEISQSILVKKLCTYTTDNRTRKAIMEYDKLIRSIYTLKYLQDRKLQRDIHRSQNRVESYHQLRAAIATAYGKKQLSGKGDREIEISNQCGRLIANAIIHYNSAILSKLKQKYEAAGDEKALAMLKKISPVAWRHIHFQGHFIFTDDKIINLDEIIGKVLLRRLRKNEVAKNCPEISEVCG